DHAGPSPRQCEACGAFNPREVSHCEACGSALVRRPAPAEPRLREEITTALQEIVVGEAAWLTTAPFAVAIAWAGRDRERLTLMARAGGYRAGWVHYRMPEPQPDAV